MTARLPRGAKKHLCDADAKLADVIRTVGPYRPEMGRSKTPVAALARAIIYQQLSGKAAATTHRRFLAVFGGREPSARRVLATKVETLRGAGLSAAKAAAVLDLYGHAERRTIDFAGLSRLEDEEVIEALTQIRGIGRWSAQMFLMFELGRPDVWATGDLGLRVALGKLRGRGELTPAQMERAGRRYAPYRSVASWYLWRSLEL